MARLLVRYTLLAAAVVLLNFALPRLLPGDPLDADAPSGLNAAAPLPASARAQLRAYYHLDRPLGDQLAAYVVDLSRGDLGWSISRSEPVARLIAERLPWTAALVLTATLVAALGGTLLGLAAAWRGGRLDRALLALAIGLAALPEFLVAMVLLLVFAVGLEWLPLRGGRAVFAAPPTDVLGWTDAAVDTARHLLLPALTLSAAATAAFALLARGAVRGVRDAPYLVAASAKGLSGRRVALRHALPNALAPLVTLFGLRLGHVLGGAIVVERVFAVPGVGLLGYEAIRARDYPVVQAVFLLGSLGVLAANLGVELAYRRLVPAAEP
jgi:peptide/nickel transport system permease protein